MSENFSLDATIAKVQTETQEALKRILLENKERFEADLVSRQQHLIEKLNPYLLEFNVGGYKYATTLETLTNINNTKLHKMVTGRYPITMDGKNRIFIDRDGRYFGHILDCLRKGKVELPSTDSFLSSRVQKEFEFFEMINVGSSSGNPSQKEEEKTVNKVEFEKLTGSNCYTWKFSSKTEGELGVDSGPQNIKIAAIEREAQMIGDTLLTSGTHQWRFWIEETSLEILPSGIKNDLYCGGIVIFGVTTKQTWEKVKDTGSYEMICGFSTFSETFKADSESKEKTGLKIDGPDGITEIGCKKKEITLTFNTQSGVLRLTFKTQGNQEKKYMLRIRESAGNEYYPYFYICDARVLLLETKELNDSEIKGMDFQMEQTVPDDGEDDSSDYEDVEVDDEDEF